MLKAYLFYPTFQNCLGSGISGREKETCSFIGDRALDTWVKLNFLSDFCKA